MSARQPGTTAAKAKGKPLRVPAVADKDRTAPEYVDVLVVGAGLSGVCAGYYLQKHCPQKTYALVEARDSIGGTWDLFRYPGIRSDSDMYTLGYSFRPWREGKAIADGASILNYVRETAAVYGIDRRIRFGLRVSTANWSSQDNAWTVTARGAEGVRVFVAKFLFMCSGYYDYDHGYLPEFPGIQDFRGQVIHPQHWPEGLDYRNQRVVVIGSGATAVTLVPALAKDAAHVTMLQRSPTYMISRPDRDTIALALRRLLPEQLAYDVARFKNVLLQWLFYQVSQRWPTLVRRKLLAEVAQLLTVELDVEKHFGPDYHPWDQRVCLVPNADLFEAINAGRASVVTDRIVRFDASGIELESGLHLDADIVVTATGLNLLPLGGVTFSVDGEPIHLPEKVSYRGIMLSDVPNAAQATGYTNASWTLKAELACAYVCRLLNYMDKIGARSVTPRLDDPSMQLEPLINLKAGYVLRAVDKFPRQGSKAPWKLYQNYLLDLLLLKFGAVDDRALEFRR